MVKLVRSPITTTQRLPASELSPGALSNPDNPRRRRDQGAVPAPSLPASGTASAPTPSAPAATHSIPSLTPRRSAAHAEEPELPLLSRLELRGDGFAGAATEDEQCLSPD